MKIRFMSDVHYEFDPEWRASSVDTDVTILAGDIHVGLKSFLCAERRHPKPLLFVTGNHEYYRHHMGQLNDSFEQMSKEHDGVTFLNQSKIEIEGVRFLGCTLWADFDLYGEVHREKCMKEAGARINDFRYIRIGDEDRLFLPSDCRELCLKSRAWLKEELDQPFSGKTVVVTHHAPSPQSIPDRYKESVLGPAFVSNLEELMGENIDLWIHGHTHHSVDYEVKGTRVVSNQKGYPRESTTGYRSDWVLEI